MNSNDKRDNPDGKVEDAEISETTNPEAPDAQSRLSDPDTGQTAPDGADAATASIRDDDPAPSDPLGTTAVGTPDDRETGAEEPAQTVADSMDPWRVGDAADTRAEASADAAGYSEPPEPAADRAVASEAPVAPPVLPQPAAKRGGGFVSGLAGGVAAATVGFGAAQFLEVDWLGLRGGEDPVAAGLAQQNTAISSQADAIAALEAQLSEIAGAVASPDLSGMEQTVSGLAEKVEAEVGALSAGIVTQLGQVSETLSGLSDAVSVVETRLDTVDGSLNGLDGQMQTVTDRLGQVDERLVAVEKRPLVESSETARSAFDAYESQVARLTQELATQQSESAETARRMAELAALTEEQISAVQAEAAAQLAAMQTEAAAQIEATQAETETKLQEAETTAQTAAVTAAIVQLEKALEDGTPYAEALSVLGDSAEVPEALGAHADGGVPSLTALRDSYPEAARDALEASVLATSEEADPVGKLAAFIRHQTGARSLAPKEGNDPDAVLSRAEAAVESGDLAAALAEIEILPEAGQQAMADWTSLAAARVGAVSAAATLVASFATN